MCMNVSFLIDSLDVIRVAVNCYSRMYLDKIRDVNDDDDCNL